MAEDQKNDLKKKIIEFMGKTSPKKDPAKKKRKSKSRGNISVVGSGNIIAFDDVNTT